MDTATPSTVEATHPADTNQTGSANPAPVHPRAVINQAQGVRIEDALQMLANASSDPEIAGLLQVRGYTAQEITRGIAIINAARSATVARQNALAEQQIARDTLALKNALARREYVNFRIVARNILSTKDAAAALLLDERNPHSIRKFVNMAHITYQTTLERPAYMEALTAAGYPQAQIEALDDQVGQLAQAFDAHRNARLQLPQMTIHRNVSADRAQEWFKHFGQIARVALRDHPELAVRLGVTPMK